TCSNGGRLVFQTNEAVRKSRLTWYDLDGKEVGTFGEAARFVSVSLSRDAERVVAGVLGVSSQRPEVRMYDVERGVGTRFTFSNQGAAFPVWAPDRAGLPYNEPATGGWI